MFTERLHRVWRLFVLRVKRAAELLEEKGVVRRDEVLARVVEMRGRKKPI